MTYSIYDKITGKILNIVETNDISLRLASDNQGYIEGYYDPFRYYIINNQAIEMPARPDSSYAEFDYTTKQWFLNPDLAIREILSRRKQYLIASDWTDLLSAKIRLGDTVYNQWQTYRQQLRDITNQAGYPLNVTWPTQPGSTATT
jgi:hypothetical protein